MLAPDCRDGCRPGAGGGAEGWERLGGAGGGGMEAVLLYYLYQDLRGRAPGLRDWLAATGRELGLRGRVRVALDGLNVTVRAQVATHVVCSSILCGLCCLF